MKKTAYLFFLFVSFLFANAQPELWGVTRAGNFDFQGIIVKYDFNGENATTMHSLNYPTGKVPEGKLLLASNGKLYGTAAYGGIGGTTPNAESDGNGVLYEYDLTFDTYRVVHYFDGTFLWQVCPTSSLIEPIPGKLYGGTLGGGFFVYDIATETVTTLTHIYSFNAVGPVRNDLIKASNGFVYAVTNQSFPCTSPGPNQPNQGSIVRINTTTNVAQRVATYDCGGIIGGGNTIVEALPNKLYYTTNGNPVFLPDGTFILCGAINEFDTTTNTITTKIFFNFNNSLGFQPGGLVLNENGNLYGVCANGGDTFKFNFTEGILNKTGTIFEYNPTTNSITKLRDLDPNRYLPINLMKLTTGDYMGNLANYGLFKYIPATNSLQLPDLLTYNGPDQTLTHNIIEVCRKPSYQFFDVTTFDGCVGGNFTYDIQNTNATSYQWLKNNIAVAGQTTGILNLTNLTTNDAGTYTCLMTNECGTTTTMPLQLSVNCFSTHVSALLEKGIKLYPNPTQNRLNIQLPESIDVTVNSSKIANSLGQVVLEQNGTTNNTIDVSQLQTGMYFITLETNYGNWNGKFIKE